MTRVRVLTGLVLLALLVAFVRGRGDGDVPAAQPAPAASTTISPSPTAAARTGGDSDLPPEPGLQAEELSVLGDRFAREFARPTTDWADRVGRLCVPSLAKLLRTVEVANIPRTGPITDVVVVDSASPTGQIRITYRSGLMIDVTTIWTSAGPRVLRYEQAPAAASTASTGPRS